MSFDKTLTTYKISGKKKIKPRTINGTNSGSFINSPNLKFQDDTPTEDFLLSSPLISSAD